MEVGRLVVIVACAHLEAEGVGLDLGERQVLSRQL
jgi:hypothetical protein